MSLFSNGATRSLYRNYKNHSLYENKQINPYEIDIHKLSSFEIILINLNMVVLFKKYAYLDQIQIFKTFQNGRIPSHGGVLSKSSANFARWPTFQKTHLNVSKITFLLLVSRSNSSLHSWCISTYVQNNKPVKI